MKENIEINISVNEKFDSLYKLGYFLVDLNSICNFTEKINRQNIEDVKKPKKFSYGITSRKFNKDSLETIRLVEFKQGSFYTTIVAPLIVGVILSIIEKYINQEQTQNILNININDTIIVNKINNIYNSNVSINENLNNILNELVKDNLLNESNLLYDEKEKKILIKNIDRMKGQLIDKKW